MKPTIKQLRKDLYLYRILSVALLIIVILSAAFYANKPMMVYSDVPFPGDSRFVVSLKEDSAYIKLDLSNQEECELANVWQDYINTRNGMSKPYIPLRCGG